MGTIVSLLVVLAVVAGIGVVVYAVVSSVGKSPDKPWEGYSKRDEPDGP